MASEQVLYPETNNMYYAAVRGSLKCLKIICSTAKHPVPGIDINMMILETIARNGNKEILAYLASLGYVDKKKTIYCSLINKWKWFKFFESINYPKIINN